MDVVGRALLILAFGLSIFGSGAALVAARGEGPHGLLPAARRSLYAVLAMAAGAFVLLEIAFIRPDFSFTTVVSNGMKSARAQRAMQGLPATCAPLSFCSRR